MKEKVTQAQIDAWKAKYPQGIFKLSFEDGKELYLRKPDRKTMSYAMTKLQTDPLGYSETILKNCSIGGDKEIVNEDSYFFSASTQLEQMMEMKVAALKKL